MQQHTAATTSHSEDQQQSCPEPRTTKLQPAIERIMTGSGLAALLEQLSNKAAYPDLLLRADGQQKSSAQIKRQHSVQKDDEQKRTRGECNSDGSSTDLDVIK